MSNASQLADVDCERAMLAMVWKSNDFVMALRLDAQDFTDDFHRWLYGHLRALVEADEPLDMVAFQRRVKQPGGFDGLSKSDVDCWAASTAVLLQTFSPSTHAEYYFSVLRKERLKRACLRLCEKAAARLLKEQHDPAAVLAWVVDSGNRLLTKAPVKKETTPALPAVVG